MDAQTAENDLRNAFHQILGRDIDDSGLAHYRERLTQGQQTVREVVRELGHSPEYKQRFIDTHPSPPDQITLAFKQFLGRDPDSQGLETYKEQMAGGRQIDSIIDDIINSSEYTNKFGDNGVPHP
jgi:phycobilisome core-membrane linker protein